MVENAKTFYPPKHPFQLPTSKDGKVPIMDSTAEMYRFCPDCNLTFESALEYTHHSSEMHGQVRTFACVHCKASFRRQDHLKRHTKSLHSELNHNKCPVCSLVLKTHNLLLEHLKKSHADNQVFHCRQCSWQGQGFKELTKHESSHGIDKHECQYCNAIFTRKDHMVRHVKSQHLNEFVQCPVCSQRYKRKDHLVRHVREKHRMGLLNGKLITSSCIL